MCVVMIRMVRGDGRGRERRGFCLGLLLGKV